MSEATTSTPETGPTGHLVQRIDALPPWADPAGRRYWCPTCDFLTEAQVKDSPEIHEIAGPDRWITRADLLPNPKGN